MTPCPMHRGHNRPAATVQVGARLYCAACAADMRARIDRAPLLAVFVDVQTWPQVGR